MMHSMMQTQASNRSRSVRKKRLRKEQAGPSYFKCNLTEGSVPAKSVFSTAIASSHPKRGCHFRCTPTLRYPLTATLPSPLPLGTSQPIQPTKTFATTSLDTTSPDIHTDPEYFQFLLTRLRVSSPNGRDGLSSSTQPRCRLWTKPCLFRTGSDQTTLALLADLPQRDKTDSRWHWRLDRFGLGSFLAARVR